ncbi:(2Fe-2S)-binding protein [Desulfoscipio gibsoniae]|uniref:Aerobic-type carbon monoxide dehydrogenase, small subunit CoxS/CutS-like protein n=1 Tax=Desulfoscipio gibsoniae DSM 7213 TaxID=767817 RepID=R4KJH4_9FIRM|nr:(2Fe-2S)-binding protein [Desulfoscipio gibsoniae]AGL00670.1 aerobic-type carbon monoxide dehydrogenase, small subunit CoxS/CutS-like protein [Desulfoscipio gibsoniae DSM 7213]
MKKELATFIVNGVSHDVVITSNMTLVELLRDELNLTGARESCGDGDCGCCTVLIDGKPTLACLTLAVTVKRKNILTIEGLAEGENLHPLQKSFVEHGALQCGYCTPGMILSAKFLLDENPNPKREEVKKGLGGNLCRCTGYNKIIKAVLSVGGGGK